MDMEQDPSDARIGAGPNIADPAVQYRLATQWGYVRAAPAPVGPQPLTPDQVKAITAETGYDRASPAFRAVFIDGIRHGERAHGIKGAE